MTDAWQTDQYSNEQPQQADHSGESLRTRWATLLAGELERIESEYIVSSNRDKYYEELEELNVKLGIIGFSLSNQPWNTTATPPKKPGF